MSQNQDSKFKSVSENTQLTSFKMQRVVRKIQQEMEQDFSLAKRKSIVNVKSTCAYTNEAS